MAKIHNILSLGSRSSRRHPSTRSGCRGGSRLSIIHLRGGKTTSRTHATCLRTSHMVFACAVSMGWLLIASHGAGTKLSHPIPRERPQHTGMQETHRHHRAFGSLILHLQRQRQELQVTAEKVILRFLNLFCRLPCWYRALNFPADFTSFSVLHITG